MLRKFQSKGLKLNPTKCHLFRKEVSYLGRKVSEHGYEMDEDSVAAVSKLLEKSFTTVGEVRQLLGLLSYHRLHVQDFAKLAKPLTDLLLCKDPEVKVSAEGKKAHVVPSKNKIEWRDEHQEALKELVKLITTAPILAYPDFSKEFFVHTDASGNGLGAILYQAHGEDNRVVAYASRTLKPSEKNYHRSKLEFLAMKWAVTEKFRPYLAYADNFKVYTDNNPLLFVMGLNKPSASVQRWISELAEFKFTIHYRPGLINKDADCLSRLPLEIDKYQELCKDNISLNTFEQLVASAQVKEEWDEAQVQFRFSPSSSIEAGVASLEAGTGGGPPLNLKSDQRGDPYIAPVIEIMEGKRIVDRAELSEMSKLLLRDRKRLNFDGDGVLRRKCQSVNQMVLPLKHRELIYKALHNDMGHLGAERVLQLARSRVFWPKMQSDVEEYTQKRCRCLIQKRIRQQQVAPLVSIHSTTPMELVSIDFLKLEKSTGGYEYILLVVDHFTRYAQAFPSKNKSALTAAKHLFNDFILKFGLPARILSDQGTEFNNKLFRELENFCGVVKNRTTPYHPQTNGLCERMNSTLLQMLRTLAESQKPNWNLYVHQLVSAYNATTHSSTGYSPHFLLFGREPILPLDLILPSHPRPKEKLGKQYSQFVEDWESRMTEAYQVAKSRCDKVKRYSEEAWRRRKIAIELHPGDRCLVRNKRENTGPGKLRSFWEQDVFVVKSRKEDGVVYEVENLSKCTDRRTLHRNMLLPCDMLEDPPLETQQTKTAKQPIRKTRQQTQRPVSKSASGTSSSEEDDCYPRELRSRPIFVETEDAVEIEDGLVDEDAVEIEDELADDDVVEIEDERVDEDAVEIENELVDEDAVEVEDGVVEIEEELVEGDAVPPTEATTTHPKPKARPDDSGRMLRSRGRNLTWNPSMGTSNVIMEEPVARQEHQVDELLGGPEHQHETHQDDTPEWSAAAPEHQDETVGEPTAEHEHPDEEAKENPVDISEHQEEEAAEDNGDGSDHEDTEDVRDVEAQVEQESETECRRGTRNRRPPMILMYDSVGGDSSSVPLTDNTGELDVKAVLQPPRPIPRPRVKKEEIPRMRRLLNYLSEKASDWLEVME